MSQKQVSKPGPPNSTRFLRISGGHREAMTESGCGNLAFFHRHGGTLVFKSRKQPRPLTRGSRIKIHPHPGAQFQTSAPQRFDHVDESRRATQSGLCWAPPTVFIAVRLCLTHRKSIPAAGSWAESSIWSTVSNPDTLLPATAHQPENSCHLNLVLKTRFFGPIQVVEFAARLVGALIGVSAEVVALGLKEVGGKAGQSIAVVVGQGG